MTLRKRSVRRTSRKLRSNKHTTKSRRTSRRLVSLFGAPARFAPVAKKRRSSKPKARKSSKPKARRSSKPKARRSSKLKARRSSKSKRRSSAPRGRWVIIVRGKTLPKKFRSSSALRAYANAKYGRGYKYTWQA